MIVITCLDQKNGMMFNHRRQSQDSVLREHVAKLVANVPLWMNHYSASQFDTESIPSLHGREKSCSFPSTCGMGASSVSVREMRNGTAPLRMVPVVS